MPACSKKNRVREVVAVWNLVVTIATSLSHAIAVSRVIEVTHRQPSHQGGVPSGLPKQAGVSTDGYQSCWVLLFRA